MGERVESVARHCSVFSSECTFVSVVEWLVQISHRQLVLVLVRSVGVQSLRFHRLSTLVGLAVVELVDSAFETSELL